MSDHTIWQLFFSANLAFIVTHLYGWLLKWYYRPQAYKDHFHELFPAQRAVGIIYLLQLFELPYLLQIADPDALLYVNAFALLFFSLQMLIMCEQYFFPRAEHHRKDYTLVILPAVIVLTPLFLQAVGIVAFPKGWRLWAFIAVSVVFAYYFWVNIRMALKIGRGIRRANEDTYADSDDFPVRFAQFIQWVPTLVLLLLAVNFYADDPWVKFVRDILFIGFSIAFCIYTLNPWRKGITENPENPESPENPENPESPESPESPENPESPAPTRRLADDRFDALARRLDRLLTEDRIFTEQHITIDTLVSHLGTNSKYLTEVIRRSGYQSFYDMISQHRVRHAISLIHQHPDGRLADIAVRCGFSSPASMSKAFASQGKEPPSSYRRSQS